MKKKAGKSVSKAVEEILNDKPFIQDVLRINAINYSGLSRYLIPELKRKVKLEEINLESVIVAVRRYAKKVGERGEKLSDKVLKNLAKCNLRLKGDFVDFTLKRNFYNYETVLKAYKEIKWDEGDVIYIYQSLTEIAVILDKKNANLILSRIPEDEIIHHEENLAMITIKTPREIIEIAGVFYYIIGLISLEGISLIDIISTYTELGVIVGEEDGAKTYEILSNRIKKAREIIRER